MIGPKPTLPAILLACLSGGVAFAAPPEPPLYDPESAYAIQDLHGFRVHVNTRLATRDASMRVLQDRLAEVVRLVPSSHLAPLRDVPIWVEPGDYRHALPVGLRVSDLVYVASPAADLRANGGWLPAKSGGIELFAAFILEEPWASWKQECQPGWLLHEFAHALHYRVLGHDHASVKAAYRQAVERKLYDQVETREYWDYGRYVTRFGPAYARTNKFEYFAEQTMAYFGQSGEYYPFTRDELRRHDPAGFGLMESVWRDERYAVVNGFPHPVSVYRSRAGGRRFHLFDLAPGERRAFASWPYTQLVVEVGRTGKEYSFARPDGEVWHLRAEP